MVFLFKYKNRHEPIVIYVFNYNEALPLLEKGEWFRPRELKWEHYFRVDSDLRDGMFHAHWNSVQGKNLIGSGYIRFAKSDDPEDVVLVGESLRQNIISRVEFWIKNINEKGKVAGNDFFSHLSSIPDEFFDEEMFKTLRGLIDSGFDEHLKAGRTRAAFKALKKKAFVQLKECYGIELTKKEYMLIHPRKKNLDGLAFAEKEKDVFEADLEDFALPQDNLPASAKSLGEKMEGKTALKTNSKNLVD